MSDAEMCRVVLPEIEFQTHDEDKVVQLKSIEKSPGGSGYKCSLLVRSRGFSCERPFYFDAHSLKDTIDKLTAMEQTLEGEAVLGERCEDEFIEIVVNRYGQVVVSGMVVEHSGLVQRLTFAFRTDQTILRPLVKDLTRLAEK